MRSDRKHTDATWVDDPEYRRFVQGRGPLPRRDGPVTAFSIKNPPLFTDPKRWAWNQIETARAQGYATQEMDDAAAEVIGRAEFDRMSGRGPFEDEQ